MLFYSVEFIFVFLPVVLACYFAAIKFMPMGRVPVITLSVASFVFYCWWDIWLSWVIIASICMNYTIALLLVEKRNSEAGKNALLAIGVLINLMAIGYFKYKNFGIELFLSVIGDTNGGHPYAALILPLGISFFTFQQITFLVDTRNGIVKDHSFSSYCLFVLFFPQLIAGPIVHHKEMMPQFARRLTPSRMDLSVGLTLFTIGLFKKIILADAFAVYANPVFAAADTGHPISFLEAWLGALSYTLQLYFDISGYADMALGLGRMFGIKLPINFNSPLKAASIIEFWQRWHMTLSRFLRDYLYYPLGGNRLGQSRRYVNLMTVMLLGGLWHGAGWTFVIWGGLHGLYLAANHLWRYLSQKRNMFGIVPLSVRHAASVLVTFVLVVIAFVPFRSSSMDSAGVFFDGLMGMNGFRLLESQVTGESIMDTLQDLVVQFTARFEFLYWETDQIMLLLAGPAKFISVIRYWGIDQIMLLLAGLGIVLFCPNSQSIIGQYMNDDLHDKNSTEEPFYSTAHIKITRIIRWRPSTLWALVMGALGVYALVDISGTAEFLYFQF